MMLTLVHVAPQLQCCANCGRAASSDTYGSGKRVVRGMAQICVHLAKTCNQPSLLLSGQI